MKSQVLGSTRFFLQDAASSISFHLSLADEVSASDLKTAAKNYILKNKVDMSKLEANASLLMELLKESMSSKQSVYYFVVFKYDYILHLNV